jgi:RHS repeat-associated protein
VTTETSNGSTWTQVELWNYEWNPRDQMTEAEKCTGTGDGVYAGKVEYGYCLSCGGALAWRKEYNTSNPATIESWKRYEYDGINLLRMDERCDTDGDGEIEEGETTWRTLEVSTHRPGLLGNLLGKRVYTYTGNGATPDDTDDYFYGYDRVGNLVYVYEGGDSGEEAFHFAQDAFGNEIDIATFGNDDWTTTTAATYGITEHQTGKWTDSFSGLYYFQARWYDSVVGRFVSRDPIPQVGGDAYALATNDPLGNADPDGQLNLPACVASTPCALAAWHVYMCAKICGDSSSFLCGEDEHCFKQCVREGFSGWRGAVFGGICTGTISVCFNTWNHPPSNKMGPHWHLRPGYGPPHIGPRNPNFGSGNWKGWWDWWRKGHPWG